MEALGVLKEMRQSDVGITGVGVVSACAQSAEEMVETLLFEKVPLPPPVSELSLPLDIDILLRKIAPDHWPISSSSPFETPTGSLCLAAARQACQGREPGRMPQALVLGTSTGGQSKSEEALHQLLQGHVPSFRMDVQGTMCSPTRLVAEQLGIRGACSTVSTACTSSANAIALAASWIRRGRYERVLAGGGDALCGTTIASFFNLQLTKRELCRPFGQNRPGMTLGEGAAFLVLESMDAIRRDGRSCLAVLSGVGLSSDAYHMTGPDPEGKGALSSMKMALEDAGLTPEDIDYVSAHGTGTQLNDATEAKAIAALMGDVPVSSIKAATGHTLAASGAIEAVLCVLALVHGHAPANIGTQKAGDDCPIQLVPPGGIGLSASSALLSNSFAFGGNNCSLVLRHHEEERG